MASMEDGVALTGKQARHLRALAHHLKPVVQVGNNGVTDALVEKVECELENHELIKVKVGESPQERGEVAKVLAERTGAHIAQQIGKTVVLYKARAKKPTIRLPKSD